MELSFWIAGFLWSALALYVLTGGADFGGGVWDFFASGPRAKAQRKLIAEAIAPIWEANHVWLILAVVLLFVAFPAAFARLSTLLHVPLTLMLLGVVLRGSAFVFRSQAPGAAPERRWSHAFSVASLLTPVFLGVSAGAAASGALRAPAPSADFVSSYIKPWLALFPFGVGFLALSLFAFLAAVYLILETEDADLRDDFRRRALAAGVVVGAVAWLTLWAARSGAPLIFEGLTGRPWSAPFHLATGGAALGALACLFFRRYAWARALAALQTLLILGG
ncbi:MAG: cytochrome d ubiquinol oxidase subunit II, partial [Elusimicrobiota bacterium]